MPTYDDALALFHEWTETDSLRRHGYAVEVAMAEMARRRGGDVEAWRMAGLLHDLDYEKHPSLDEHPTVGVAELERLGYPEEIRTAILGHAPYLGVPRETDLAKALFAVDELAGFVTAVAHVRPTGLDGMTVNSVKKKLKDKRFAAAVSREDIQQGAEELGLDLGELIQIVIDGMAKEASRLGFA
ncbi:HDIG domain-containing metalloprotein [Rubrivirga marina]|uniref:HAD family hydrolase n=1 Tax=Rubrivirga marina TaxID=1196024 RepID=A0A271IYC8_9BACT|nr:HDIG domain-containing metalloprotein [Rubrivirga marina]PAP76223.1 HAD family hydrolase [Rubrivirga marina]